MQEALLFGFIMAALFGWLMGGTILAALKAPPRDPEPEPPIGDIPSGDLRDRVKEPRQYR